MVVLHYEEQIDDLHPPHRQRADNPYIASNTHGMEAASGTVSTVHDRLDAILQCVNIFNLIRLFNPPWPGRNDDPARACHYYKYNFTSLCTLHTIEFRQHNGTFDPQKIKETIVFYLTFVRSCLVRRLNELCWLDNGSEPIHTFVKVIM
ncbi:hypothetical protein CPB85DRAFT_1365437 [Mucidula mucida]|nr:hypothetical protein CPB85DRAFT_1365437 [Mucidula mucida]